MQTPEQQCVDALRQCFTDLLDRLRGPHISRTVLIVILEDMQVDCLDRIDRTLPMMTSDLIMDGYKLAEKIVAAKEMGYPYEWLLKVRSSMRFYLKRLDAAYPVEQPPYAK